MEIFNARALPDGSLVKASDGRLVKDDLAKVFVMGKAEGAGASAKPELRTGDWVYSAFLPDLTTASPDAIDGCRSCHLPLADKDFVHRYDEYFAGR
jgi:hemoglobin